MVFQTRKFWIVRAHAKEFNLEVGIQYYSFIVVIQTSVLKYVEEIFFIQLSFLSFIQKIQLIFLYSIIL